MQYQDVKPTAFSDPANDWRNEINTFDGDLSTFADNQPDQTAPQNIDFSGQTINLGLKIFLLYCPALRDY